MAQNVDELTRSVSPFAGYHFFGGRVDGWAAVDEVLAWIRSEPLADAFTYGKSTLPMWFDARSNRLMHHTSCPS